MIVTVLSVLQENITETYVRQLLESAKLANMNMLRVWGGGVSGDFSTVIFVTKIKLEA